MTNAYVKLAYRQVIDITSQSDFERDVFNDSYQEFLMQVQTYNQDNQYTTWQQVRTAVPKAEEALPYKVGFAITLYVRDLQHKIPRLTDTLGQAVAFAEHRFALLDSSIADKAHHRVALTYLTDTLLLLGTAGNYLLLTAPDQSEGNDQHVAVLDTFMVEIQPGLSIVSYRSQ